MKKIYTLLLIITLSITTQAQVVISQVYGGGGNGTTTAASYANDFIELLNTGTTPQSLNGWSIQYSSATGPTAPNTWLVHPLPNFTLQPGQYFLIQESAGTNTIQAPLLPTSDFNGVGVATSATDTTLLGIAMSASNGKVILVNSVTPETITNPSGSQIIDKVGYGTTPTGYEGTGPTGTTLSSTTSAQRNNAGCTDTNNNSTDFTTALPLPRNSSSPFNTCSLSTNQNTKMGLIVYPNPVNNGLLNIQTADNTVKNVVVYDLLGKQVLSTSTSNTVNVSSLKPGVYTMKITEDNNTGIMKIVIN
jgi:hypothetical protein